MTWLRHLLSIALLPFTMTVLIPLWIARSYGIAFYLAASPREVALQLIGVVLLAIGLTFFVWSLRRFAVDGHGTLAPWDPPRELVVHGPYRYVRNPMISGVAMVLFGEAALMQSAPHAVWALMFSAINLVYIPAFEERQLADRFGEPYREYCRNVPRLFPRATPWTPSR